MSRYTRFPKHQTPAAQASDDVRNQFSRGGQSDNGVSVADHPDNGTVVSTRRPQASANVSTGSKLAVTLFLVTLMIPVQLFLGSLQLTANRLVLLVLVVPLLVKWASGQAGKIYGMDFMFLAYVFWMSVTLFMAHGSSVIDLVGITFVETVGAFMIGRVFVRTPEDFERVMNVLFYIMLALVPAAILESITGFRIYSEIADVLGKTHNWVHGGGGSEKRLGMFRAHTVFEHPILFGTFSASIFGLLYFGKRRKTDAPAGYRRAILAIAGTFFSLSSGAIISFVAQMGMVTWDSLFRRVKHHWKILLVLVVVAFAAVDLLSNRTPFQVFITYAAFSSHNGYVRIAIFNYGMDNVWANPIFGIGQADWFRPGWLHSASVDNFWLLMALRHGFPGFLLIAGTFLGTVLRLGGLKITNPRVRAMRHGMVFALIGLSLSLMTVHVWGITYTFICFLLGTGVWMRDYAVDEAAGNVPDELPEARERVRGKPPRP